MRFRRRSINRRRCDSPLRFTAIEDIKFYLFVIVATVKTKHIIVNNYNGLVPQCDIYKGRRLKTSQERERDVAEVQSRIR
jgi:hypothetical protein